jgi:hypothetical protein
MLRAGSSRSPVRGTGSPPRWSGRWKELHSAVRRSTKTRHGNSSLRLKPCWIQSRVCREGEWPTRWYCGFVVAARRFPGSREPIRILAWSRGRELSQDNPNRPIIDIELIGCSRSRKLFFFAGAAEPQLFSFRRRSADTDFDRILTANPAHGSGLVGLQVLRRAAYSHVVGLTVLGDAMG